MIEKWMKIITGILLGAILCYSVITIFEDLNQYSTADQQQFSMTAIKKFLKSPTEYSISDQYNISNWFAYPGKWLDGIFKAKSTNDSPVFFGLKYSEVLGFNLVHLFIVFLLIAGMVILIARLFNLTLRKHYHWIILLCLAIINYPTFKGVIKVFTYDSFSVIMSFIALFSYFNYIKCRKKAFLYLLAIFSAWAFIEKVSSFSTIIIIWFVEFVRIVYVSDSAKKALLNYAKFLGIYLVLFFVAIYIAVPGVWTTPAEMSYIVEVFFGWFSIFFNLTLTFALILIFSIIFLVIRYLKLNETLVIQKISGQAKVLFIVLTAAIFLTFAASVIFQKSILIDMSNANPEVIQQVIKNSNYYSTGQMAQVSLSGGDSSQLITAAKVLFSDIRLFIFVSPEIYLLLLLLIPVLLFTRLRSKIFTENTIPGFVLMTIFGTVLLGAYAFMITPVYPRYNLMPYLFFVIIATIFLIKLLDSVNFKLATAGIVLTCLLIFPSINIATPAHFGYTNILRSRNIENNEFLDFNKYVWTYVGWGESAYQCQKYLEKNTKGEVKAIFDYLMPFVTNKRIKLYYFSQIGERYIPFTENDFITWVNEMDKNGLEYLMLSRIQAYRSMRVNYVIKNYRHKAIFIDKVCDVEQGWVFKIKDLLPPAKAMK